MYAIRLLFITLSCASLLRANVKIGTAQQNMWLLELELKTSVSSAESLSSKIMRAITFTN